MDKIIKPSSTILFKNFMTTTDEKEKYIKAQMTVALSQEARYPFHQQFEFISLDFSNWTACSGKSREGRN